jgi:hypothetical protein
VIFRLSVPSEEPGLLGPAPGIVSGEDEGSSLFGLTIHISEASPDESRGTSSVQRDGAAEVVGKPVGGGEHRLLRLCRGCAAEPQDSED